MTRRLCLRCDWEGDAPDAACPSCGASLYRPVEPPNPDVVASSPAPRATSAPGAPHGHVRPPADDRPLQEPSRRPGGRVRAVAVSVVAAVILAASAFAWVQAHTPPPAAASSGLQGRLVYAVRGTDGWARLWTWDLERNTVSEGPLVRDPVELVNAYGPQPGWIGVTSRLPDGRLSAGILRYLAPTDRATPLFTGDLVAWGAYGDGVAGARRGPAHGCHRRLQVVYRSLVPRRVDVQVDRTICGDAVSLGRDDARTYLTLRRGADVRVVFAGVGRFHPVLRRYALAGVSPAADMLVVPGASAAASPTYVAPPGVPPAAVFGTGMFFSGLTGGHPIAYEDDGRPLQLERVLAWSPDASDALVAGRTPDHRGLFELAAGPAPGGRTPVELGASGTDLFATFADDGTGFVLDGASVSVLHGGELTPLPLPSGAPAPAGPIVWIR